MAKVIIQFGYMTYTPPPDEAVLDCRVLPNPWRRYIPDATLKAQVRKAVGFDLLVNAGVQLLAGHDRVYVGCLHGRHRSGAVAEEIARQTGAVIVEELGTTKKERVWQ